MSKEQIHLGTGGFSPHREGRYIQEMYATENDHARQLVVTEAAKSYLQVPPLAEALQKAACEVGDFAVDLMEALRKVHWRHED